MTVSEVASCDQRGEAFQPKPDAFNWYDAADTSIVIPPQDGIAAYVNDNGDVVIRRQADADLGETDDAITIVNRPNLPALIDALRGFAA